jgi:hypothetical protein
MAKTITNSIFMDEENGKKFCALYGVEDTDEDFSFALVVPPPAEVDDDGKWNDWRTENWGVKWDAADIGNGISVSCLTEDGELDFETPWAPPIGVYEKMAADGLEFTFGWESDSIDDVLVGGGEAKGGRLAYGIDLGRLAEKLEDDGVDADEVGEPEESSLECWQDEYGNFGDSFGDFAVLKTGFWGERVYAYPVKAALEGKEAAPAPICKMPSVYRAYYTEEYDEDEDNLDFLFVDLADDCDRVFLLGVAGGAREKGKGRAYARHINKTTCRFARRRFKWKKSKSTENRSSFMRRVSSARTRTRFLRSATRRTCCATISASRASPSTMTGRRTSSSPTP